MRNLIIPLIAALSLSGCVQAVSLEAAEDANNPVCAEVMVRLPATLGEHEIRYTNAQATAAWGNPAVILLRCGLEPVEVSALPCVTAGSTDWLVDESAAPNFRFISYATTPAVEVVINSENASGVTTLEGLAQALSPLPKSKVCTTSVN
ncbi:MAG: DUF3515 family protein [Aquiluna sp.]|nr:DUF3515 family protein [Aquiluna sp.]